ncbi:hypothetical protein ABZV61_39825 [Streptomyces sp900116325]|uniref:Uncharacterized protein n=1 Tax=Streptomyces sp. 900116325 TaxID=3154295 RepID=A0ABV2ULN6_9ACTN
MTRYSRYTGYPGRPPTRRWRRPRQQLGSRNGHYPPAVFQQPYTELRMAVLVVLQFPQALSPPPDGRLLPLTRPLRAKELQHSGQIGRR